MSFRSCCAAIARDRWLARSTPAMTPARVSYSPALVGPGDQQQPLAGRGRMKEHATPKRAVTTVVVGRWALGVIEPLWCRIRV